MAQQSCTVGFPSTVSQCTSGCDDGPNQAVTLIIPDMNFTCTGTVAYWRAAGVFTTTGNRNTDAVLSIWRETSDNSGTYVRMGGIQLGTCGNGIQAPLVTGMSNIYECTLPQSERVSVEAGDVIGIEIAENGDYRFRLYSTRTTEASTITEEESITGSTATESPTAGSTQTAQVPITSIAEAPTTNDYSTTTNNPTQPATKTNPTVDTSTDHEGPSILAGEQNSNSIGTSLPR